METGEGSLEPDCPDDRDMCPLCQRQHLLRPMLEALQEDG
jgi:hypothetical protein